MIQDKRGALYTAADRFNKDFGPGQPSTGWLAYALDTTRHTTRGHTYHVFDHQIAGFGSNAASVAPVHGMHEDRLVSTMPQSEVEMQLRRHQPGVIGRGMAEDSELYTKGYVSRGPHKVVYVVIADRAHGRRGGETARGEVQYTPYTGTRRLRILGYALPQWELVHAGLAPDGSSVETADRLAREAAADEVQPS